MNILRFLALGDKKLSPFNITHRFTHLFWLGDLNYRVELPTWVRRIHLERSCAGTGLPKSPLRTDGRAKRHMDTQNQAKAAAPLWDSSQLLSRSLCLSLQFLSDCVCFAPGLQWPPLITATVPAVCQPASSSLAC